MTQTKTTQTGTKRCLMPVRHTFGAWQSEHRGGRIVEVRYCSCGALSVRSHGSDEA